MQLRMFQLSFHNLEIARRDIPKIRGYISSEFPQFDELHNHNGDRFIYRYPLIQYKMLNRIPSIIGIEEGANILSNIAMKLDKLKIKDKLMDVHEIKFVSQKCILGDNERFWHYQFISPWMCLNEKNYQNYIKANNKLKSEILKKILIGNILSMSKRFNYTVTNNLETYINLNPVNVNFKNKKMLGFKGEFIINFKIPNNFGLGKSVSRGFGTIKLINKEGFM